MIRRFFFPVMCPRKGYRTKAHPLGDRDESNIIRHLQLYKRTAAELTSRSFTTSREIDVDRFIAAENKTRGVQNDIHKHVA